MSSQNQNHDQAQALHTVHADTLSLDTLALQLTPCALRKPLWKALTPALLTPLKDIAADIASFVFSKRFRMDHNGQVRLLERVANLLMLGTYDKDAPAIRLDEADPVEEFLIAPDIRWSEQGTLHYDLRAKALWDYLSPGPDEPAEAYTILADATASTPSLGFEVHLAPALAPDAAPGSLKAAFLRNGGLTSLCDIIDTYKLAGKRYTVIQDRN